MVFVCHKFGNLVAKQIVVSAKTHFSQGPKVQKLLKNIGAILFFSTPHHGLHLAKFLLYSYSILGGGRGPLLGEFGSAKYKYKSLQLCKLLWRILRNLGQ